jgi:hypothetical protein
MFSTLAQQQQQQQQQRKGLQAIADLRFTNNLINWPLTASQLAQMFKILLTLLVWRRPSALWIGMATAIPAIWLSAPLSTQLWFGVEM